MVLAKVDSYLNLSLLLTKLLDEYGASVQVAMNELQIGVKLTHGLSDLCYERLKLSSTYGDARLQGVQVSEEGQSSLGLAILEKPVTSGCFCDFYDRQNVWRRGGNFSCYFHLCVPFLITLALGGGANELTADSLSSDGLASLKALEAFEARPLIITAMIT